MNNKTSVTEEIPKVTEKCITYIPPEEKSVHNSNANAITAKTTTVSTKTTILPTNNVIKPTKGTNLYIADIEALEAKVVSNWNANAAKMKATIVPTTTPPTTNNIIKGIKQKTLSGSKRTIQSSGGSLSTATTSNTTGGTNSSSNKKKPYRRTKRPVGYNDKSSVTTTTDSMFQNPLNVYDTVLEEAQDLFTAAKEAQQLGRLKMSSTYLLLLHARLVGLGKRFDKAYQTNDNNNNNNNNSKNDRKQAGTTIINTSSNINLEKVVEGDPNEYEDDVDDDDNKIFVTTTNGSNPSTPKKGNKNGISIRKKINSTTSDDTTTSEGKTQAVQALKQFLPNIDFDTAMIEHLAKAAAELQAARSGRSSSAHPTSTLPTPDEFLAATANQTHGVTNAALQTAGVNNNNNNSIAWTAAEILQLNKAVASGKEDPKVLIDLLPGRSEQQVKAYLRNQTERARVEADLELPDTTTSLNPNTQNQKKKKKGKASKTNTSVLSTPAPSNGNGIPNHNNANVTSSNVSIDYPKSDDAETDSAIKRKGGRGRKPQTAAMNTVPNAICNARALLQGGSFKPLSVSLKSTVKSPSLSTVMTTSSSKVTTSMKESKIPQSQSKILLPTSSQIINTIKDKIKEQSISLKHPGSDLSSIQIASSLPIENNISSKENNIEGSENKTIDELLIEKETQEPNTITKGSVLESIAETTAV